MPKHKVEVGDPMCDSSTSSKTLESNDDPRLEYLLFSWYFLGVRRLDEFKDDHDAEDGVDDKFVAEVDTLFFLGLFLENNKCKRLDLECFLMVFLSEFL
jgi:hypothetical protein